MPRREVPTKTVFTDRVVSVGVTLTINKGNFESIKIYAGFTGAITDDVSYESAYKDAFDIVIDELDKQQGA